jgi:hypothetical protein
MMQVVWCRFGGNLFMDLVKLGLKFGVGDEAVFVNV